MYRSYSLNKIDIDIWIPDDIWRQVYNKRPVCIHFAQICYDLDGQVEFKVRTADYVCNLASTDIEPTYDSYSQALFTKAKVGNIEIPCVVYYV